MTITRSCLKLRCPSCKGKSRLDAESFAELRRRPNVGVDHTCEHCGHEFVATLLSGAVPTSSPKPTPAAAPATVQLPHAEVPARETPTATPAIPAVPFAPKAAAPTNAPPFGLLGEDRPDVPARARSEAPVAGSSPPFAAGAALNPPKEGKQSLNEWWKSQSPKRQWTFIACFGLMIGAAILSLDSGKASGGKGRKKAAVKAKENPEKPVVDATTESAKEIKAKKAETVEPKSTKSPEGKETKDAAAVDSPMGLLYQETVGIGGKVQTPLAAAWAIEGKGFLARGAKVFADLHNAGDSTSKWVIQTSTKRYKVTGVKFHPEFPAAKLKSLVAKGGQAEMLELIKKAERVDVAMLETEELPTASMTLARDPAVVSGKALVIASPVEPKAAKVGQASVKFANQPLTNDMLKEEGVGLSFAMAPGVDAAVTTKEGMLVAFVPRRNAPAGKDAVHPIIPAETLAELVDAKSR
jgi:hypothetical protein